MDITTSIKQFVTKHPEPQQFKITLNWHRKDGQHQKTYGVVPSGQYGWRSSDMIASVGHPIYAQHYLYDSELELCELAIIEFPHNTPKDNEEPRKWQYLYRYFVPKNTRELYDINGYHRYRYVRPSYSGTAYFASEFANHFTSLNRSSSNFTDEFLTFCGDNALTSCSSGRSIIDSPWQLASWFSYKPKVRTNGAVQKKIDALSAIDLDTISPSLLNSVNTNYRKDVAYFDVANKVFRIFDLLDKDNPHELRRVYIANKPYVAVKNPQGEWVTNGSFTENQFGCKIVNYEDIFKLPHFEYFRKLTDNSEDNVYTIVGCLKNPEIEQLVNMGLIKVARTAYRSPRASLTYLFGKPNNKKNVLQKYGVTHKQALVLENYLAEQPRGYYRSEDMIKRMKQAVTNISALDLNSFTELFKIFTVTDSWRMRCLQDLIATTDDWKRIIARTKENGGYMQLLVDTISTLGCLSPDNKPNVTPMHCNYAELSRLHDQVVELKRIQDAEQQRLWRLSQEERNKELERKMVKLNEIRQKYNYDDGTFHIRVPEKLAEITKEGADLHHCVGGYTDSHARGNTTILFLRKDSEPNKSFYTIELKNDGTIQQIHGFGNKWLGNDPDAVPTVMRWLKRNGITCADYILLSTATGYCNNGAALITKPQI